MPDSRAGAGEVMINLEYFVVPGRREVLTKMPEMCQKIQVPARNGFPLAKSGTTGASNQMDYNPFNTIGIYEQWLTQRKGKEQAFP